MDGFDLAPILFGSGKSLRDTLFYYRGADLFAVRKGAFKAHFQTAVGYGSPGAPVKFVKHDPPLLFNLASDPSENVDVAKDHPEILAEIQREAAKHRANLVPGTPQY